MRTHCFFKGAQESLEEKVTLKPCETYDLSKIQTPADYQAVANSSEALEGIENCMNVWLKQLEQVLAESEQMRKEADDIGPRAELDHWKKRMSRFNYLLDQIKGPDVKAVLGVLHASQSKLIKVKLPCFLAHIFRTDIQPMFNICSTNIFQAMQIH